MNSAWCLTSATRYVATARTVGGRGTLQYKAPELFRTQKMGGARYDRPADVFSFAVLIWETFTGEVPWAGVPEVRPRMACWEVVTKKRTSRG